MFSFDKCKKNVVLGPFTTYKIGGPADYFYIAKNKNDLQNAVIEAKKANVPYFILGTGANILISDKGFRGLVIKNESINISVSGNLLTTESGTTIAEIIEVTKKLNLSGFEHFAGIPSTIGGALWQNLHFLSPDRKSTVFIDSIFKEAEVLDENNKLIKVNKDFFNFGYDKSVLHNRNILVTEAVFVLSNSNSNDIQMQINENLKWRSEKQPQLTDYPSCGSVFKKIDGVGAGRLIDQVGLKGYQVGNAKISEKHANYIVNLGGAKANDIISIISFVKKKVRDVTGYNLETEISFIGEF